MNAERFRGGLEPLVAANLAEGWFIAIAAESEQADFEKPRTALFGVYDKAFLGVCGLVQDPYLENSPDIGRLRHYVLPTHRCQGIATSLATAVVEEAQCSYRVLGLRTMNPDAARLYETLGFAVVDAPAVTHVLEL